MLFGVVMKTFFLSGRERASTHLATAPSIAVKVSTLVPLGRGRSVRRAGIVRRPAGWLEAIRFAVFACKDTSTNVR